MALPQGINNRSTSGFATDGANEDYEIAGAVATYPRTSAQGNTVGWEPGNLENRDRQPGNDRRLAGLGRNNGGQVGDYRIDLPSAGDYKVGLAAGDGSYSTSVGVDLLDTATNLATLASGSTGSANNFKDATNTTYSAANWPASQTIVQYTFATTILRFRMTDIATTNPAAHFYVEAVAGAADPVIPTKHFNFARIQY